MADEIVLHGTAFARRWPVGLGISYVKDSAKGLLIGVAAKDLETGDEGWHDVHHGEVFEVAGQQWQVSEVRYPQEVRRREVVLRRIA